MLNIAIIGGGAAGMAAAIAARRQNPKAIVMILEHKDIPGKKILSTGNGRCNLTNEYMDLSCFRSNNQEKIGSVLEQFSYENTLHFFEEMGIMLKSRNGYIYPRCDQAAAVLEILQLELKRLSVDVKTGVHVNEIIPKKKGFQIRTDQGNYITDKVILATGSKASKVLGSDGSGYSIAKSLGHHIIPVVPALVQLKVKNHPFTKASGVRTDVTVTAVVDGEHIASDTGELQITNYGISGIPVFQISRYIAKALYYKQKAEVEIDFLPQMSDRELEDYLWNRRVDRMNMTAVEFLMGIFNQKLIPRLLELSGIKAGKKVSEMDRQTIVKLSRICKHTIVSISDTNGFDNAQICAGGVSLKEINEKTMESAYADGLYIVGELLDVDGICGGYNLQWAWSTGMIAGKHAAKQE